MRSIQKQRIQRSLQKSQEGRKKLEEKLEAISGRDRELYGHSQPQAVQSEPKADKNTRNDRNERNMAKYEEMRSTPVPEGSGSILASKGGFQNMKNKDQIRDQMLANISKIKSFRETGEFDMTSASGMQQSVSGASITNTSDRMIGPSDVILEEVTGGTLVSEFQPQARAARASDQVLMEDPSSANEMVGNERDDASAYQTYQQK